MKYSINFLLVLTLYNHNDFMNNFRYENLLGQDINKIIINDVKPKKSINLENIFSIYFKKPLEYYNSHLYYISFKTNEDQEVNQLHIDLISLIDEEFYNNLINAYGKPDNILIKDGILSQSESNPNSEDAFHQNLKKTVYKTKEGSFKEKPVLIFWDKDTFQIKVLMMYERKSSKITFMIKE